MGGNLMKKTLLATGTALFLLGSATVAPAAMLGGDPGAAFDMPGPGDYYLWTVDLDGFLEGDTVLDFTVTVPAGGAVLSVFQVFGGDSANQQSGEYKANFSLVVNDPQDTWTEIDYDIYWYHNYLGVPLAEGQRTFKVTLTGAFDDDFPVPDGRYADVRFGDGIAPAVPLPAPALLLLGGMLALAGLGGRKPV
jgi:hypothetical protein